MNAPDRLKSLYAAFSALILLLMATIGLSFVDLGAAHTSVGIGIALVKTLIVAAVFMNLLAPNSTVRLASAASMLWLSFLILFVMGDYLTRGWAETQERRLENADHYTSYDRVEYSGKHIQPHTQGRSSREDIWP
ncbi:hypothetical protein [Novipirellula rosea]|uniref:Oxidase n=1 Tax=Novipirellula rosea TaxID=1031540 RepID=A0ABP8NJA2_9BACT